MIYFKRKELPYTKQLFTKCHLDELTKNNELMRWGNQTNETFGLSLYYVRKACTNTISCNIQ